MNLSADSMLGSYQVIELIGRGGMGEVWRARDTKLDRDVAIKVVPSEVSGDAERMARFQREAQVLASLNHTHIAAIYGLEEADGTRALILELVEGQTIAERLAHGAIPVDDALMIARQIAEALEAAHEKGIIHRDLKPANVKLTDEGKVKVLDFGLAKAHDPTGSGAVLADSPTITANFTRPGVILGTAAYMSPEQARGKPLDHRTDIWSFGCVLYECLTGKRPFVGETTSDIIGAILHSEPEWKALPPDTPPAVRLLLRSCLAKDRGNRIHSIADARVLIDETLRGTADSPLTAPVAPPRRAARERLVWVFALVAVTVSAWLFRPSSGDRLNESSFNQLSFRREPIFLAAFAPDGKTVVYSAAREGNVPEIFTVRPEYPEPQPLGLPDAHLLSVSSQGELAVLVNAKYVVHRLFTGTLARMPLGGGAPREILENVRQADWSSDGTQLAIIREVDGVDRLEYPIGTVLCESSGYLSDLRFSPTGDRIAYFEHPRKWDDRGSVNIVDLAGKSRVLSDGYASEVGIAWSPDGGEILFSATEAGSAAYRVYAVSMTGQTRTALQSAGGLTIHDIAQDGRWLTTRDDSSYGLMVHLPDATDDRDLSWLDGSMRGVLSQDGRMLLFAEAAIGTNYTMCLRKTDNSPVVRLGDGHPGDLSPDGKLALAIVPSAQPELVLYPTGAGETRRLERGPLENYVSAAWFPDGKRILICGSEPESGTRYYVQDIAGGAPRPVTPEGTRDGRLDGNGEHVLARQSDGQYFFYPIAGGEPRPAVGLDEQDVVIRCSADGRSALTYRGIDIPCRLERVDLATGRRELFKEVAPADRTGLLYVRLSCITDDEQSYAYMTYRQLSSLFVTEHSE